jgi:hypothetical protein
MQRAFYNGHNKYHGGKVQHVLQADGIVYSFTCPIHNHDALVLHNSTMHLMLSSYLLMVIKTDQQLQLQTRLMEEHLTLSLLTQSGTSDDGSYRSNCSD